MGGSRVRFGFDVGEYSEAEEEAKLKENRMKYKKPHQAQPDIKITIQMKRISKEISIKCNDPLITTPYNKFYLSDKIDQKKYLTDAEICKLYCQKYSKKGIFPEKKLRQMQQSLSKIQKNQQEQNINYKDLS